MTSEVTQAALEPCPFCGGKAEWKDDPKICGVPFGLVVDHKPDCFLAMPMSEEAMLAAWNTRLTAQSGEGRSGAVRRDWVPCPICHEPDMRQEIDAENNRLIFCVNHSCPSNGAIEGRSGAGEDAGPFHVSQSGDGKNLWFSARDPASGVTIPARDRTDARNLVSSLNRACATFAALNARQSGEGERLREALERNSGPLAEAARIIATRYGVGGAGQASVYAHTKEAFLAALCATDDAGGA